MKRSWSAVCRTALRCIEPVSPGTAPGSQYFARHAEPEAALASALAGTYSAALVVPLCRESLSFLDGYEAALGQSADRVLLVAVVNAAEGASAETHSENQRMLAELALRFPARVAIRAPGVS